MTFLCQGKTNKFMFQEHNCIFPCFRPIFQGSSSVDQLLEIVSLIGPMTSSDFADIGIDESFALADVITKQNLSPRSMTTFKERLQNHLGNGIILSPDLCYLFEKVFCYVPSQRWDAEHSAQYIQWNL